MRTVPVEVSIARLPFIIFLVGSFIGACGQRRHPQQVERMPPSQSEIAKEQIPHSEPRPSAAPMDTMNAAPGSEWLLTMQEQLALLTMDWTHPEQACLFAVLELGARLTSASEALNWGAENASACTVKTAPNVEVNP